MTDVPAPPAEPHDYDFSGLPARGRGEERPEAGVALRLAAISSALVLAVVIAVAGAAVAAGSARDIAGSTVSLADQPPAFSDLFVERIGAAMQVFGSVLAALAVGIGVWLIVRPRSARQDG